MNITKSRSSLGDRSLFSFFIVLREHSHKHGLLLMECQYTTNDSICLWRQVFHTKKASSTSYPWNPTPLTTMPSPTTACHHPPSAINHLQSHHVLISETTGVLFIDSHWSPVLSLVPLKTIPQATSRAILLKWKVWLVQLSSLHPL